MTKIQFSPVSLIMNSSNQTVQKRSGLTSFQAKLERTPVTDSFEFEEIVPDFENSELAKNSVIERLKSEEEDTQVNNNNNDDALLLYALSCPELSAGAEPDEIHVDNNDDDEYEVRDEYAKAAYRFEPDEDMPNSSYYENHPDDYLPFDPLDEFLEDIF